MENLIIENKVYKSLHDIFTYQTGRVEIDYDKREVLVDLTIYGNEIGYQFKKLFKNYNEVKTHGFNVSFYVRYNSLKSYLTSKTSKHEVKSFIIQEILPNYFLYSLMNDKTLVPFTEKSIELIELENREKNRHKNFIKTIIVEGRIPKIKPFKVFKTPLYSTNSSESLKIIKSIGLDDFKKYFKLNDNLKGSDTYYLERQLNSSMDLTLDEYNNLLAIGLNPDFRNETINRVLSLDVFSNLGEIA
jgi:hypothetical protein